MGTFVEPGRPDSREAPAPRAAAGAAHARFGRLALELTGDGDGPLTLDRLLRLLVRVLDAAEHAGLTVHHEGHRAHTLAATDDIARHLERLQSALGEGPGLDAAALGTSMRSTDATGARDTAENTRDTRETEAVPRTTGWSSSTTWPRGAHRGPP